MLEDYAARMARTLDQAVVMGAPAALPAFPQPRAQGVVQQDVRLGLRDAWAVRECLGALIATRNSGLGRVMRPSQRLIYESAFHVQAASCLDLLAADTTDEAQAQRAMLRDIVESKRSALQDAISAFVLRDAQMAAFWRLPAKPMALEPPPVREDVLARLSDMLDRASHGLGVDGSELERALAAMQGSLGLGQVAQAEALAIRWLNATTAAMHARLDRRPLCFDGVASTDARIAQTIFSKVYVGEVQPWLAQLRRAGLAARTQARAILAPVAEHLGDDMRAYQSAIVGVGDGSLQADFLLATQAHSQAWQRLLMQCGMMPKR